MKTYKNAFEEGQEIARKQGRGGAILRGCFHGLLLATVIWGPFWMWWGRLILCVILAIVVGMIASSNIVRVLWRGGKFTRAIRDTTANNKEEALFVDWLRENPHRVQQKDVFFQVMVGLGISQHQCAYLVMRCITGTWKPDGKPFGELLAMEIERNTTVVDLGDDPQKDAKRKAAMDAMNTLRVKLLALDAA